MCVGGGQGMWFVGGSGRACVWGGRGRVSGLGVLGGAVHQVRSGQVRVDCACVCGGGGGGPGVRRWGGRGGEGEGVVRVW